MLSPDTTQIAERRLRYELLYVVSVAASCNKYQHRTSFDMFICMRSRSAAPPSAATGPAFNIHHSPFKIHQHHSPFNNSSTRYTDNKLDNN